MKIKTIIFDFGNVLAFFDHKIACRKLAELSNHRFTDKDIYNDIFKKDGIEEQFDRGLISIENFLSEVKNKFNIASDVNEIRDAWSDIFSENNEVIKLLPLLKGSSYRLILASNTNELHFKKIAEQFGSCRNGAESLDLRPKRHGFSFG